MAIADRRLAWLLLLLAITACSPAPGRGAVRIRAGLLHLILFGNGLVQDRHALHAESQRLAAAVRGPGFAVDDAIVDPADELNRQTLDDFTPEQRAVLGVLGQVALHLKPAVLELVVTVGKMLGAGAGKFAVFDERG